MLDESAILMTMNKSYQLCMHWFSCINGDSNYALKFLWSENKARCVKILVEWVANDNGQCMHGKSMRKSKQAALGTTLCTGRSTLRATLIRMRTSKQSWASGPVPWVWLDMGVDGAQGRNWETHLWILMSGCGVWESRASQSKSLRFLLWDSSLALWRTYKCWGKEPKFCFGLLVTQLPSDNFLKRLLEMGRKTELPSTSSIHMHAMAGVGLWPGLKLVAGHIKFPYDQPETTLEPHYWPLEAVLPGCWSRQSVCDQTQALHPNWDFSCQIKCLFQ